MEWAAQLPWSSGAVGTLGASYDGWTQWELAHTRPPHLKAMAPFAIAANLLDRELSGVLRVGRVLDWTVNNLAVEAGRRAGAQFASPTLDEASRRWVERDRHKWFWYLPLWDIPEAAMPNMRQHWRRWLQEHAVDHFGFEEKHCDIDVPVLCLTGWYDQQIGTIKNFTGMVENGRTAAAQRDFYEMVDQWFGRWLKEENNQVDEWPPIQLFVMGANSWRAENEWPLARTQ